MRRRLPWSSHCKSRMVFPRSMTASQCVSPAVHGQARRRRCDQSTDEVMGREPRSMWERRRRTSKSVVRRPKTTIGRGCGGSQSTMQQPAAAFSIALAIRLRRKEPRPRLRHRRSSHDVYDCVAIWCLMPNSTRLVKCCLRQKFCRIISPEIT